MRCDLHRSTPSKPGALAPVPGQDLGVILSRLRARMTFIATSTIFTEIMEASEKGSILLIPKQET